MGILTSKGTSVIDTYLDVRNQAALEGLEVQNNANSSLEISSQGKVD